MQRRTLGSISDSFFASLAKRGVAADATRAGANEVALEIIQSIGEPDARIKAFAEGARAAYELHRPTHTKGVDRAESTRPNYFHGEGAHHWRIALTES